MLKISKGAWVESYIQKFKLLHSEFLIIGLGLNKVDFMEMIVNIVFNSYDSHIQGIFKFKNPFNFDNLVRRLLHKDSHHHFKYDSKVNEKVLFTRTKRFVKPSANDGRCKLGSCNYCASNKHWLKEWHECEVDIGKFEVNHWFKLEQ